MLEPAGNKLFNVEARAFVLEMRKAGILVDLVATDAATVMQRLKRGEFDLAPMIWQGTPDEVPAALFASDGAFNYGGYRSSAFDALLDEARGAAGPVARAPVLARILRQLADDQPVIFLYRYDVPALVAGRVRGLAAVAIASTFAARGSNDRALLAGLLAATPAAAPATPSGKPTTPATPARGCLPAAPLPGLGAVDPFRPPDPKATELNSAGKSYYRDGKWEEARIEVPRRRDRRPDVPGAAAQRGLLVRPPGALRRGHGRGRGAARARLRPVGARGPGGLRPGRAQGARRDGAHPSRDDVRRRRLGRGAR